MNYQYKTLTVRELIDELSKFGNDLPVITEGCDCYGDIASLEKNPEDNFILLKRGTG